MEDCSMRDITLINATDFEILAPAITLSTDSRYAYCPSHSRPVFSSPSSFSTRRKIPYEESN